MDCLWLIPRWSSRDEGEGVVMALVGVMWQAKEYGAAVAWG